MQPQYNSQIPTAVIDPSKNNQYVFKFLSYYVDKPSLTATFFYQGVDNFIFTEKVSFAPHPKASEGRRFNALNDPKLDELLDRATFLAFMLIGTSYYKSHPTPNVQIPRQIDPWQAEFFNKVYQEGLSQYAYENGLTRNSLAHFVANTTTPKPQIKYNGNGIIALQSGGKDSLLVANMLLENHIDFTPWYVSSSQEKTHPKVLDNLFPQLINKSASIVVREIDLFHLQQTGGLNGHVPVTFITESLALIQAILNNQNIILTSIGQEGTEPAGLIGDLPINHQWSKTLEAEKLMTEYIKRYVSEDIHLGSPIRKYSELRVAELFVEKCWKQYGYEFSSCNQANYKQNQTNSQLHWCGECAKCANTYLLFCPFLAPHILQSLFADEDLFKKPTLTSTFKGLLGINNSMKPFECVGSVDELRYAYHHRMEVGPQRIPKYVLPKNYDLENTSADIAQASERLKISK